MDDEINKQEFPEILKSATISGIEAEVTFQVNDFLIEFFICSALSKCAWPASYFQYFLSILHSYDGLQQY